MSQNLENAMRINLFLLIFLFFPFYFPPVYAGTMEGDWQGQLKVNEVTSLKLVIHIQNISNQYFGTFDSPDQGGFGIKMDQVIVDGDRLQFFVNQVGLQYSGLLKSENIEGIFKQSSMEFPLVFSRYLDANPLQRPQTPQGPFPYQSEDVSFKGGSNEVDLKGTLTYPKDQKVKSAIVLVSGSGPQNRDEEIFGHKPFLVIADFFSRRGYAVLRYDDRGVGESTGDRKHATSYDYSLDAEAAVTYLQRRVDLKLSSIGIAGHSEGALIATMIGTRNSNLAFAILLGAPGVSGKDILLDQGRAISEASKIDPAIINLHENYNRKILDHIFKGEFDEKYLKAMIIKKYPNETEEVKSKLVEEEYLTYKSEWMRYFIKYDPGKDFQKMKIPVLAMIGENDLQVTPKLNIEHIQNNLQKSSKKNYELKVMPGLNHLFQSSQSGLPSEYGKIEETFSHKALESMLEFLQNNKF